MRVSPGQSHVFGGVLRPSGPGTLQELGPKHGIQPKKGPGTHVVGNVQVPSSQGRLRPLATVPIIVQFSSFEVASLWKQ